MDPQILVWTFTLFFLGVPVSLGNGYPPHTACSTRVFKCGDIQNVTYPFWGGDRPAYCGLRGFELRCKDNYTVIELSSITYRVLSVNQFNRSLVIARLDLWENPCTENFIDTTLNESLFSQSSHTGKVALFYDCGSLDSVNPIPGISLKNKFSCPIGNGERRDAYFVPEDYISSFKAIVDGTICQKSIEVPVREPGRGELRRNPEMTVLQKALKGGFEVVYTDAVIDACFRQCGAPDGIGSCGRNLTTQQPVCFCRDQPYPQSTCPASSLRSSVTGSTTLTRKLIIGFSSAAGAAIIVAFIFLFRYLRSFGKKAIENKNVEELLRNYGSITPKRYSYSDIKLMTKSFKKKLGQGGYGSVYKGKLHDGHPVAVKFLKELKGNGEEFINEVVSISRTSHVNIVTLLGFCFDGQKRALIYEFMPNVSLDKFIYDKKPLTSDRRLGWETLHQIATGIARGLEYLHRGCNTRILHFDIKPQNILLDEELCPKISDFGLAKLCTRKESAISMLVARGTVGYIAPEVFSRQFGYVSHKSDVYSYGMMVLEMAGVRNNTDQVTGNTSDEYFPHWIYRHLNLSGHLALHGISTEKDDKIARKMVLVGLWCIQTNPSDRPSISKVLEMLEGDLESLQIPPKPFLSSPPRSPASSPTRSTTSKQSTIL